MALHIAEERREAKSKGENKRYTHLNAEFQRIARRDKKAFLNEQCKEIEENNRMGKTQHCRWQKGCPKPYQAYRYPKTHYWAWHSSPRRQNPAPATIAKSQVPPTRKPSQCTDPIPYTGGRLHN